MEFPVRFGKYDLIERIAMGGMAEVFLARSFGVEGFEKKLVIKRILPGLSRSPRFVNMFIKEAKITAGLAHPNIVQTYELGKVHEDHYIAMELVHGQDLAHVIRAIRVEQFRMPMGLAVHTVAKVLRGLGYAHNLTDGNGRPLNLVHRDISPHNVMLSFQGEVKIFDFGIARLIGESSEKNRPAVPGGGKFAYMSPEQAMGQAMDSRSDVYSAGILLYELLVGERLFWHPDPAEKLRRVREAIVPDPREQHPGIPDALWDIMRRMLALNPDDRPARAELAEEELWGFLFSHGLRADGQEMAAFLRDLFPDEGAKSPSGVDLAGLAEDLARLEQADGATRPDPIAKESSLSTLGSEPTDFSALTPGLIGMGDESKTVVVLAVEVLGFTAPSESQEPDTIIKWQERLARKLESIITRYGGRLHNYEGDQFLVLFGVPKADEHDLERAVACADTIVRAAAKIEVEGRRVGLCIGMHRGELAVSSSADRFRFLSRGNTVKWARRLAMAAKEGEILASNPIAELAGSHFIFQKQEPVWGRGARQTIPVWKFGGQQSEAIRGTGRWLRRGGELAVFADALTRLSRGSRTVLKISGDAGTGKTWLVHELSRLARARGLPVYTGRAPPYAHDRPLSSLRELVAQVVGVEVGDSAEVIRERLLRLIQLGLNEAQRKVIGGLFGVETVGGAGEGAKDAIYQSSIALVRGLARDQPVILVLENAQHLSGVERRLVQALIHQTASDPIMFLFTARRLLPPELGKADFEIKLEALSQEDQRAMVCNMMGVDTVDPSFMKRLGTTAEGNPMYLEAVLRALKESGHALIEGNHLTLVSDADIPRLPPGLDGLIEARVDALDPTQKGALQVASLIGLGFSRGLLQEAIGLDGTQDVLAALVQSGLLKEDGDGHYQFASTLVWEVVSSAVIGQRKRDYHLMVASGMERHYVGHLDVHRQELARHWAAAGRTVSAAVEGERGGILLMKQQLLEPAAKLWERSLQWLAESRGDDSHKADALELESRLRQRAGSGRRRVGENRKAEVHLQIALDLAGDTGNREVEADAQLELGRLYQAQSRNTLAVIHLEAAMQAAEMACVGGFDNGPDWARRVAVTSLEVRGILAREAGLADESASLFQDALSIAGEDDGLAARALLGLATARARDEGQEQALSVLSSALEKARNAGDRILTARILNNTGIAYHMNDEVEEALRHYRSARDLYRTVGYAFGLVVALHNIGDCHVRLGAHGRAWASFQESSKLAEQLQMPAGRILNEPFMAYLEGLRALEGDSAADPVSS